MKPLKFYIMDIISIVATILCLVILAIVTYWFINKRNPTKISSQEDIVEKGKRPSSDEIQDPMNP